MNDTSPGSATPPPIPKIRSNWLLSSVLILVGIFLTSAIFFYSLGITIWGEGLESFGKMGFFGDYTMFSVLIVALVTDLMIERRQAVVWGALVTVGGIFLMMLGASLFYFPGLVLLAIGNAMMSTSLFAYFGSQWAPGEKGKGKLGGYALAFGIGGLGGGLGNYVSGMIAGSSPLAGFLGATLLLGGYALLFWMVMQSGVLKPEAGAPMKKGKGLIGALLLVLFGILSFVGFGLIYYFNPGDGTIPLFFLVLTLLAIVVLVLILVLRPGLLRRDKLSMALLPVVVCLFVVVNSEGGQLVWGSLSSMVESGDSFDLDWFKLMRVFFDVMMMGAVCVVFLLRWVMRKKMPAESMAGIFLGVGGLIVALFPQLIAENSLLGLHIGGQLTLDLVYLFGSAMVFAYWDRLCFAFFLSVFGLQHK